MKTLYILRHGQAEPVAASDEQRLLTPHGHQQASRIGRWLAENEPALDAAFCSPYMRARQTAQGVLKQWQPGTETSFEPLLQPDSEPAITTAWLDTLEQNCILLVSHMPLVARLTMTLCPTAQAHAFPTAGLAKIDLRKPINQLVLFTAADSLIL